MKTPHKIEERKASHIWTWLVDCGLVDCSFFKWWRTFDEFEGKPQTQDKVTWYGSLGELGYLATELYGVERWTRLYYFYKLPKGKGRLKVRAVQSTLSRIGYKNLSEKYPHIKAILESKPPTIEELLERYRR